MNKNLKINFYLIIFYLFLAIHLEVEATKIIILISKNKIQIIKILI